MSIEEFFLLASNIPQLKALETGQIDHEEKVDRMVKEEEQINRREEYRLQG